MTPKIVISADVLQRMSALAQQAGREILDAASSGLGASKKSDGSPLTLADARAHQAIVAALAEWDPSTPIVSEEGVIPDYEERRQWSRMWLVDPLDGTKEFLKGLSEYSVNIALIESGVPVLGVVHAPALGLTYFGGQRLGSWKQEGQGPAERIYSAPPAPGERLTVVESRSHPSEKLESFLRTIPIEARIHAGSSLKFCWVAEGRADIYPRFGRIMEWDTAAGDCVFRYSGRDGDRWSPLGYNTETLAFSEFVIGLPKPD